jgi:membrane-bound ClpP family serine protease
LAFCRQLLKVSEANADDFLALAKELEVHNDMISSITSSIASHENSAEKVLESRIRSAKSGTATENLRISMINRIARASRDNMDCSSMYRLLVKYIGKENRCDHVSFLLHLQDFIHSTL